jgi:eukaryotic-like serine/threonine-protein kinase
VSFSRPGGGTLSSKAAMLLEVKDGVATPQEVDSDSDSLDAALRALAHAPPVDPGAGPVLPGTLIGESFRVEEPIGAGGMGLVYRAWDVRLQRRVAIKLHAVGSESGLNRLLREARALARLSHHNVITVHEVGTVGDRVFIAMEYVDGVDASVWLAERPRALREILDLFVNAAHGLVAAHAAGLIHRDFKPSNVLVGHDGRVLVADFGLARHVEEAPVVMETGEALLARPDVVTAAGSNLGSSAYMAPEQREGMGVDARADQYAFCVALHEAVSGALPAASATRSSGQKVPRWLQAILQRGLEQNPENRFASMDELLVRLQNDPNRGRRRIVYSLGVTLAIGGTAWATHAASSPTPCHDVGRSIEEVWQPAVALEIEESMRRTGSPLAETATTRIVAALDAYASRWSAQRHEACEATRVRGDQSDAMLDRRYACLERRRQELAAVIDVLRSADSASVERAVNTLGALGSLDGCADNGTLDQQVAPPDDLGTRQAVEELGADLMLIEAKKTSRPSP